MTGPTASSPLLSVNSLKVYFPIRKSLLGRSKEWVKAVDDVTFTIKEGQTIGLVGESGSGKTTIGRTIVRLQDPTSGSILYEGRPIHNLSQKQFRPYRKKIQMIFQDPHNSLNPRLTIESILREPLDIHFPGMEKKQKKEKIVELLEKVGLSAEHLYRYPHEFSGGQRQRIGIARALAVGPKLIICDEPVSALDVSVQAQIINLLMDLQQEFNLSYLFISHDLAVVEYLSDYVLVLNKGRIVEEGSPEEIYKNPKDEYTKKLIASIPSI
ncbi:ABC transporter ATP-binding protein [Candidatus Methylacidiphilum fumarolicum]|uniref:ABC-type oligopeptide transport system, ATPase component n=1 Tax=Candidatus Methylacidiphilum fumarolicum TaxID=591154 RepID=A0ABM9IAJ5_9BACT|nr:ATP-binding cassette domain-containing protein [Candidatus Methylacidiphilum fumarolicum]MBW6414798.1 ATP-binding cassette domain-containing protein [Candidatus Methylacidiphilum fumarolicum]TFE73341.1 ABC transporter ATP-binding protein [Candidatus Methylacidiphilum fumarolicum]TFE74122.1 ABC transporter ATP-binding protein [Candidatus Methylacidiphilum fumarolicum]CAI9084642.1 ABC-type oligopeptide transport system, ATPase component [Candidatus Methylacidiphilum fumarolicum]